MHSLGSDKFVNVTVWEGQVLIHLRKYTEARKPGSDLKLVPTKTGIALSWKEWEALLRMANEVTEELSRTHPEQATATAEPVRRPLGNDKFVTVTVWEGQVLVHVRKYFDADQMEGYTRAEDLLPTKKGIALKPREWEALLMNTARVNQEMDEKYKEMIRQEVAKSRPETKISKQARGGPTVGAGYRQC